MSSTTYGITDSDADARAIVRTVLVIDPQKKVRLTVSDPPNMGDDLEISTERNFQDILRVVDSLQSTDD